MNISVDTKMQVGIMNPSDVCNSGWLFFGSAALREGVSRCCKKKWHWQNAGAYWKRDGRQSEKQGEIQPVQTNGHNTVIWLALRCKRSFLHEFFTECLHYIRNTQCLNSNMFINALVCLKWAQFQAFDLWQIKKSKAKHAELSRKRVTGSSVAVHYYRQFLCLECFVFPTKWRNHTWRDMTLFCPL